MSTEAPSNPTDTKTLHYDELHSLNGAVAKKYHEHLKKTLKDPGHPVTMYLAERGIDEKLIDTWQLGYAPADWQFLTRALVEKAVFEPAVDLGVCVTDGTKNRDFFYNRLIIPIKNEHRKVIGFTGRAIPPLRADTPKYLNIRTTALFTKGDVLFGLDQALRTIKTTRKAVLTEGNFDVTSLHWAGITGAVGKGGTALTEAQVKKLTELAEQVTLIYDTDGAGQKALDDNLTRLLLAGLRVKVFYLPGPEGQPKTDADEWVRTAPDPAGLPAQLQAEAQDGLLLLAERLLKAGDLEARVDGQRQLIAILAAMKDGVFANEYLSQLAKKYGLDKKELTKAILSRKAPVKADKEDDFEDDVDLPTWVDREDFLRWGFADRVVEGNPYQTGSYFAAETGYLEAKPMTNFTMKPLYHIKDRGNVSRLVEMNNGKHRVIVELPSKALNSVSEFENIVTSEGFFNTTAKFGRPHLKKITNRIMANTPEAFPVKTLGWQPENFFAYSNVVFNGKLATYDEHGVVKVGSRYFFSPAISPINQYYRLEQDEFKFDRYLTYAEPPIDFATWGRQMRKVYGERAMVGVVFVVASLFKDIVRRSSKIPILYCYGPKDSGKSTFAESILYLFFGGKDADGEMIKPLNLGSMPTGPAFWATMARFRNCPMLFNEFDDNTTRDEFFTAFKSSWDGEGRIRGTLNKTKTEEQSVNCTVMLVGQYLSNKDDGSVNSRSLCFEFVSRKDNPFSPEEIAEFDKLRDWQKGNLSGILTALLPHRKFFEETYQATVRKIKADFTQALEAKGLKYASRTFENMTCLMGVYETLKELINWPMTREEFWGYSEKLLLEMSSMLQESDALSAFWSMMAYLLDRGEIEEGWDFKIETAASVKVATAGREAREIHFEKPTRLLFLRISNVHKRYQQNYRQQTGDNPLKEQTLTVYLKQQGYFVGSSPGTWFRGADGRGTSSSCYILDYDQMEEKLGIGLERLESPEDIRPLISCVGSIDREPTEQKTSGKPLLQFYLRVIESTGETPPRTETYTIKCFSTDLQPMHQLMPGSRWRVTGYASDKKWRHEGKLQISRMLDVVRLEAVDNQAYDQGFGPLPNAPF